MRDKEHMERVNANRAKEPEARTDKTDKLIGKVWDLLRLYHSSRFLQMAQVKADPTTLWRDFSKADQKKIRNVIEFEFLPHLENKVGPDLLVYWNPEIDYGVEYNVEVYKHTEICEICGLEGAYVIRDDRNSVGICRFHIEFENEKQVSKVVELPSKHEY